MSGIIDRLKEYHNLIVHTNINNQLSMMETKLPGSLEVFRIVSLSLASALFLLRPEGAAFDDKLKIVAVLFLTALLLIVLYRKCRASSSTMYLLTLAETAGMLYLLGLTGGLNSVFIWYAVNPLLLASAYVSFLYAWLLLGVFFRVSLSLTYPISYFDWAAFNYFLLEINTLLALMLITLGMQIFLCILYNNIELTERLRLQQEDLSSAYINLSEDHQTIHSLSAFQREVISLKSEKEIFSRLAGITEMVFPFHMSCVLLFEEQVPADQLTFSQEYHLVCSRPQGEGEKSVPDSLTEVKERWGSFSTKTKMILGEKHDWLAIPIWSGKNSIRAVFVAWIKHGVKLHKIPDTLYLYVNFTEQVIQRLNNYQQLEQTLQHVSSLYEAAETISSSSDPKKVIDLFAVYAKTLTGSSKVVFWLENTDWPSADAGEQGNFIYTVRGKKSYFPEDVWLNQMLQVWSDMQETNEPIVRMIDDDEGKAIGQLISVPVKSSSRCFGLIAALRSKKYYKVDEVIQTLSFLADLSAVSIERNNAEVFAHKLYVIQEQNRIANELHDSISQNLFNIVYGLKALEKKSHNISDQGRELLHTIQQVASTTSKEVRLLIYRLSPGKRGESTFVKEIKSYLDGLGKINQVAIDLDVKGKEEFLSPATSKAFYRIIKEATGNAVRHGKCSRIQVELEMKPFISDLTITDNGNGFDSSYYENMESDNHKLGLVNMRELAGSLQGNVKVESGEGKGTVIRCHIPTSPVSSGTAAD